jgi:hypothetical protein
LELLKNEFPWIPENRTHGGVVCYTVRLTYITRSRTQAELKKSYFKPVLVQEPTDPVGQTFKWYRVEDSILCANGMKPQVTENVTVLTLRQVLVETY